jgi:hypothetical protein
VPPAQVRLINAIHVAPEAVLEVQYVLMKGQLPPGASGEAFVEQGLQIKAAATTATNVVTRDADHLVLGLYYVKQPATPGSSSSVPSGQWSLCNTGIYWEATAAGPMVPLATIVAPVVVGCALLAVLVALLLVYRRRQRGASAKGGDAEKANGARQAAWACAAAAAASAAATATGDRCAILLSTSGGAHASPCRGVPLCLVPARGRTQPGR